MWKYLSGMSVFFAWLLVTSVGGLAAPVPLRPIDERSPLSSLRARDIPDAERRSWHPPELVGILGQEAGRHWDNITQIAFSPSGKRVATVAGTFVYLWDVATLRLLSLLDRSGQHIGQIAFLDEESLLCCGGGTVRLWDLTARGEPEIRWTLKSKELILGFTLSPNNKRLATGQGELSLWNLTASPPKVDGTLPLGDSRSVAEACFSPDSRRIAVLSGVPHLIHWGRDSVELFQDQRLSLWSLDGKAAEKRVEFKKYGLGSPLAFLPDGRLFCHGSLWDVSGARPKAVGAVELGEGSVNALHPSPSGEEAVLVTSHEGIQIWRLGARPKFFRAVKVPWELASRSHFAIHGNLCAYGCGNLLRVGSRTGGLVREGGVSSFGHTAEVPSTVSVLISIWPPTRRTSCVFSISRT